MELGEILRAYRSSNGLTQKKIAAVLGITREHYAMIEEGHKYPARRLLLKMKEELKLEIDYFLPPTDGETPV